MRTSRSSSYGYGETVGREKSNPYWASFTDLMASVMIIFLLTTVYFALMSHALIESNDLKTTLTDFLEPSVQSLEMSTHLNLHDDSNQKSVGELTSEANLQLANMQPTLEDFKDDSLTKLHQELQQEGIDSQISQHDFVLHIPTDQLAFKQGYYEIDAKGKKVINTVAKQLYAMLINDKHLDKFSAIAIEGHTDSVPADSLPMGNWGLSSYRAINFWKTIIAHPQYGKKLASLNNIHGQNLFSVSGYADTRRLVQLDDTAEKQAKNRRIDIRFTVIDRAFVDGSEKKGEEGKSKDTSTKEKKVTTSNFSAIFGK